MRLHSATSPFAGRMPDAEKDAGEHADEAHEADDQEVGDDAHDDDDEAHNGQEYSQHEGTVVELAPARIDSRDEIGIVVIETALHLV
jgi:hypothetical protein